METDVSVIYVGKAVEEKRHATIRYYVPYFLLQEVYTKKADFGAEVVSTALYFDVPVPPGFVAVLIMQAKVCLLMAILTDLLKVDKVG